MGRTLDTLRHGEMQRSARVPVSATAQADSAPEECVVDWTLQEEVPFIEVGGPGKSVEYSPLLIKHAAQARVQPPHQAVAKGLATAKAMSVANVTELEPMAVAFEAWPRPATPAGVAPEIIAHHQPAHAVSKQYAALFDKMLQGHAGSSPLVVLLCGLRPHVGTSTVLLNLAVIGAHRRRRVVIGDVNLAQPCLATRLGYQAHAGLPEVIAGNIAIGQAVVPTGVAGLHLLPGGTGVKNGSLTVEAGAWLTAWLRERFDLLLMDGPSVENAAAMSGLVPNADDTYLVLPQEEPDGVARGIAQSVARMGGRLRGLIHTHFDV
jgi:Mrp family chromosome partitioning ATPase